MPNSIDGVTGVDSITKLWKGHFEQLFNCTHDNDITSLHYDHDVAYTNDIFGTVEEIQVPDGKWTRKPLAYRESNNYLIYV